VLEANAATIRATTLASKLLQLALPGVPDVYQGQEILAPSLVDPDNRRPVDFAVRSALLDGLRTGEPHDLATEKLWVTSRALKLRSELPELFGHGAGYEPLLSTSPHALGFVRAGTMATVVTRWPGLLARSGWKDHVVTLAPGLWNDVLTGALHAVEDGSVRCEELLGRMPVALLARVS
jgi:(1->4)-alpha-D-glucan 1-alpha-D-glucosylmutase